MKVPLLVLIFLFVQALYPQSYAPKTPLTLNVDISQYQLPPDKAYLEINYAVYPSTLTLESIYDTLQGSVILQAAIKNLKTDSLVAYERKILPIILKDTASIQACYIGKLIFEIPIGSYEVILRGFDGLNPARRDSLKKNIMIKQFTNMTTISDLDLCTKIIESDKKNNLFYKNSYEVVPNPSLLFGGKAAPVVFSYAEIYNLHPDSVYSIVVGVADGNGNIIKQRKRIHQFKASNVVDVNYLNISSLPSNKYNFVMFLEDTLGREIARSVKTFFIHNPQIPSDSSNAFSSRSVEFAAFSEDEINDEFRKAQYIASAKDRKAFEKLTTKEAKQQFMAEFWTNIESGRSGNNEMMRLTYLDRVSKANQRYHVLGKDGWRTDRGRVYILYGEPDEVERIPSSENARPYETWRYNQIESGVQFVFVDRSGFGEYILVHSTKRGELQDAEWERNLK